LADVCIWSLPFMLGNSEKSLTYLYASAMTLWPFLAIS
jgi:hypothetical protein